MKRGDVYTVAGGKDYAGKPRPVVIIQDDNFSGTDSVTICAFTSDTTAAPLFRLPIAPTDSNGLKRTSYLMVDKVTTVPKTKLGARIGLISDGELRRLNRALLVFLGLASSDRRKPSS